MDKYQACISHFVKVNIFVTWLMAESASLGASLVDVILIEFRETGLQGIEIGRSFEEQYF